MKAAIVFSLFIVAFALITGDSVLAQQSTTGPVPPVGIDRGIKLPTLQQVIITGVPSYINHHGCGPTAVGMVVGYWDSNGFPNLVPGDASNQTVEVNAMIADDSENADCDLPDGDHYQDYSCPLDFPPDPIQPDRSETGGAHTSNCLGDFMQTSWSSMNNYYLWSWFSHVAESFVGYANLVEPAYGPSANSFYFADFSFADYMAEVDAGRPVVLLVDLDGDEDTDHFVTGIGYDNSTMEYGVFDTWDNSVHWFDWAPVGNPWGIYGVTTFSVNAQDWWPMFRHDLNHTGYSSSTAPNTSLVSWSYTTGSWVYSSPAIADGKVYVGSVDYNVYCLDASNGDFIWSYITAEDVFSSPAVADGKVYVGSDDGNIYCLDALNGDFIWSYTTGYEVWSSPAVADGKVYVGSGDCHIYCLDASTGQLIWSHFTHHGLAVSSSPAVAYGKIYVGLKGMGEYEDNVYCLDASNGDSIWSIAIPDYVYSSPAVSDGKVYVGSNDSYCLDAETGDFIWSNGYRTDSSPAVAYGKIYVGSGYEVICLDISTGDFVWSYTTGHRVKSSPAVADGKVYVGSMDHNVYCLDASTGQLIWSYTTGDKVYSSPAVADGKVYVGSDDGKVYCFGSSAEPIPTLSEWGMIILALLLLAIGTVAVVRRRKVAIN